MLLEQGLIQHTLIFGSRAKGNYQHGSDTDLAILKPGITDHEALMLSARLNQELPTPYHYDMVAIVGATNALLKEEILAFGKPLIAAEA